MIRFFKKKKEGKAFSILEIALSFLVIGMILAAVIHSAKLMVKANLIRGRQLTSTSSVNFIKNLSIWHDAVSKESYDSREFEINGGDKIGKWLSIAKVSSDDIINSASQNNDDNKPLYVATNYRDLPLVKFNGDDVLSLPDDIFPSGNSPYTIFIVAKIESFGGTVLEAGSGSNINRFSFESSGDFVVYGGSASKEFDFQTGGSGVLQIIAHSYDGTTSNKNTNKVWVNGVASSTGGTSSGTAKTTESTPVNIGSSSGSIGGHIGEIIVFNRALNTGEREDIEKYLSKKWNIDLTVNFKTSHTCTVTGTGVAPGQNKVSDGATEVLCGAAGFKGTAALHGKCSPSKSTMTLDEACQSE